MYLVRFILMCTDAVNDFLGKNCQYIAGAIAFYTLFSMFPLVLAMVSIWGFFFPQEVERATMAEQMAEILPVSSDFIGETMRGVVSARTITGVAAVVRAGMGVIGSIRCDPKGHQRGVGGHKDEAVHPGAIDRPGAGILCRNPDGLPAVRHANGGHHSAAR